MTRLTLRVPKSFSNTVDRAMIEESALVEGLLRMADVEARLVQLTRYATDG